MLLRSEKKIEYIERLMTNVRIPWEQRSHVSYIKAEGLGHKYSFNLLGFLDLCTLVLLNHYIYLDFDKVALKKIIEYGVEDLRNTLEIIWSDDPKILISFKGEELK
jgi:hypothetical protein